MASIYQSRALLASPDAADNKVRPTEQRKRRGCLASLQTIKVDQGSDISKPYTVLRINVVDSTRT